MISADRLFDRSGALRRPPYRGLVREAWSFLSYHPVPPDPADFAPGEGHVVLVVPGYFTTDAFTSPLRKFLSRCGYRAFGWNLGVNWGPTDAILGGLRRRLDRLRATTDEPVSLVGISLGGLFARDLAFDRPDDVMQVITLVSPVRLPTASPLSTFIHLGLPFYSDAIDLDRVSKPLPMPSTAIFTRNDGLVAWQSCALDEPGSVSAEVGGQHVSVCRNPQALRIVAERLAAVRRTA
ncbi:MAG TPA: hypothetical protein VEU47_00430 [Candidatus Cybelea sp.]|nr:hypothetical protein [Candidatus Cybelea sp.]